MMKRLVLAAGVLAALTSPVNSDDSQKEHQQFLRDAAQVLYSQDDKVSSVWRLNKWPHDIHLATVGSPEAETIATEVFSTLSATAKLGFTRTSLTSITDTYPDTGNVLFITMTQADVFKADRTEVIELSATLFRNGPVNT